MRWKMDLVIMLWGCGFGDVALVVEVGLDLKAPVMSKCPHILNPCTRRVADEKLEEREENCVYY